MHFASNSALCTSKRNKIDPEYITLRIMCDSYHLKNDVPVEQVVLVNIPLCCPNNPVPFLAHYGFCRVRETSNVASCPDFKYMNITVFLSDYVYLSNVMYRRR